MSTHRSSFDITADVGTDVWRSPSANRSNAPSVALLPEPVPLSCFERVKLTVQSDWASLLKFDQGGLYLHITPKDQASSSASLSQSQYTDRWLKAGVEVFNQKPQLSVVGTYVYSDWSVTPLLHGPFATIEAVREDDTLWVYAVTSSERQPLREVSWFFAEENDYNIQLYASACRPAADAEGRPKLSVHFSGIEVEVSS